MHQTDMVGAILVLPYLYGIDLGRCTPLFPHGNTILPRRRRLHHRRIHNPPPIDCCVFLRLRRPLVPRLGPRSRRPSTVDTAPTSFPTEALSVRPPLEPRHQRPPSFRPSSSPPPSKAFSAATVHINPPPIDCCFLPTRPPSTVARSCRYIRRFIRYLLRRLFSRCFRRLFRGTMHIHPPPIDCCVPSSVRSCFRNSGRCSVRRCFRNARRCSNRRNRQFHHCHSIPRQS